MFGRGAPLLPKSFVGNAAWQAVSTAASLGLGFLYAIVVARALGPAPLGVLTAATAFATLVYQALELRLHEAVIRWLVIFEGKGAHAEMVALVRLSLLVDLGASLLATLCALALVPLLAPSVVREAPPSIVVWSTLGVLAASAGNATATGVLRVRDGFRAQAILRVFGAAVKLGATWAALRVFGAGTLGVAVIAAVVAAAAGAAQLLIAQRKMAELARAVPRAPAREVLRPYLPEIRAFVRSSYALSLTSIPTKNLDVNLLAAFVPVEAVGVYRIAKNFYSAAVAMTDPFFFAVYPEIARLWARGDGVALRRFLRRLTVVLGGGAVVLAASLWVVVPVVVARLLSPGFAEASRMFRWMIAGPVVWAPLLWLGPLMAAAGRPDVTAKSALVGAAAALVGYFVAARLGGAVGVSAMTGVLQITASSALVYFGRRAGVFGRLAGMGSGGVR